MKNLLLLLLFLTVIPCDAQVTSSDSNYKQNTDAQFLKIKEEAGKAFKIGLDFFSNNQKELARKEFDKSIEAFLISNINIEENQSLKECYEQLIETIYRLEFSNGQIPQIRSLSGTCGWNINPKLADDITKKSQFQSNSVPDTQIGFEKQSFEPSPLDKLAKLELKTTYSRPTTITPTATQNTVMTVKAQQGDTVETLAKRHGANAVEVAKFNGLFITTKLNNGREIKIPSRDGKYITPIIVERTAGTKPKQLPNGTIPSILRWFNEYANDPYSLKIVRWGKIKLTSRNSVSVWTSCVKFRAKNAFGAYRLASMAFYFNKGEVLAADEVSSCIE